MGSGNSTHLHTVLLNFRHVSALTRVREDLKAHPEYATMADGYGFLPLHMAAREQTDGSDYARSTVLEILQAYPEGASKANNSGWLPLHLAAKHQTGGEVSRDIVLAILKAYPQAASTANKFGWLPLHLAVWGQTSGSQAAHDIVQAILEADPKAASQPSTGGDLPLHFAAKHQRGEAGLAVVKMLVAASPTAVGRKNSEGKIAVQYVSTSKAGEPVADWLTEMSRGADAELAGLLITMKVAEKATSLLCSLGVKTLSDAVRAVGDKRLTSDVLTKAGLSPTESALLLGQLEKVGGRFGDR